MKAQGRGYYYFFMHPKTIGLLQLTPREKWKIKYRSERLAKKGKRLSILEGEVGSFGGVTLYIGKKGAK